MSKIKKYICPFAFSALFWILYIIVTFAATVMFSENYGGLAVFFLFVLAWVYIIVPFYCVKYVKLIRAEKLKFLFAACNPIILAAGHMLPFFRHPSDYIYFIPILIAFLVWATLWSILPLVIYQISLKKQAKAAEEEAVSVDAPSPESSLLENKKKRIIVLCFTLMHTLTLVFSIDFAAILVLEIRDILFPLALLSSVLTLVYALSHNKNFWLKKHLLPIAFGANTINCTLALVLALTGALDPIAPPVFSYVRVFLSLVFAICMLVGTLRDFKRVNLLKYGALGAALMELIGRVSVIAGHYSIDVIILIRFAASVLFYVGIFILATDKKAQFQAEARHGRGLEGLLKRYFK